MGKKWRISNKAAKAQFRKASPGAIEDSFVKLPAALRASDWLVSSNHYRLKCTATYKKQLKTTPPSVNHKQLAQYVAASSPTHVIDGWSYLGRAVDATLRGDAYSAMHAAYYAELRAAMSLLASQGIGVFDRDHPIIESATATQRLLPQKVNIGTHAVVWPMLQYWSTLSRASKLVDGIVKPNEIPLSRWLSETGASGQAAAVARHWFASWGLDLAGLDSDHDTRNLVSYRPSEFRRSAPLSADYIAAFVEELWSLFEPSSGGRFRKLEGMLLRGARRKATAGQVTEQQLVLMGFGGTDLQERLAFLNDTSNPLPLTLAESSVDIEDGTCHLRMISRAALLLYMATAASRRHIDSAELKAEELEFWWGKAATERALWDSSADLDIIQDTWADIADAIGDSRSWRDQNLGLNPSLRDWRRTQHAGLLDFGSFERVGIWGLVP